MSIHFGDSRDRFYGDDDFGRASFGKRPSKVSDEDLKDLVDAIAAAGKVKAGSTTKVSSTAVDTKVTVNGSEYDVRLHADGTFKAERTDGQIEISLTHTRTWGGGVKFTYTNHSSPDQSGDTTDGAVCDKARDMARNWYKAAKKNSLDI